MNVPVVIGGYHPSILPEEAKQHADSVVIGEAEKTWSCLLQDFEEDKLKDFYFSEDFVDPKLIPSAYHGALPGYQPCRSVQATRGCPYRCEFCIGEKVEGSRLHKRSIENVIEEIKSIKSSFLFF